MTYTMLHLSDLHRSPDDPISNQELLSTLVVDQDRFRREEPPIPLPDAIIVSGDLVQGVPLGTPHYRDELQRQYAVAQEFLESLATEFLSDDRSRLVIVPGNHDVDWNIARAAMAAAKEAEVPEILSAWTFGPISDLRWNWADRRVYQIIDRELYDQRLQAYRDMRDGFYASCNLPDCSAKGGDYDLFELAGGRIGLAAFNSCQGNDCFSFHGAIPEEAIAQAHLDIVHMGRGFELLVAVWHHSLEGPPYASDYMDAASVYQLIAKGFRVGLHGHQHRAEVSQRYIHLPDEYPMAVISAGSLCAGGRELPRGVNRQYNIIELSDALDSARVHIREMAIGTTFAPARRADLGEKSYVELGWATNRDREAATMTREREATLEAERALAEDNPEDAIRLLEGVERGKGTYARTLYVDALSRRGLWEDLVDELESPSTPEEVGTLVKALGELRRFDAADAALDLHGRRVGIAAGARRDFEAWISAQRAMHE